MRAWWVPASVVPLLFAALAILRYPAMRRFEFNTDEGINLIKALLVQQGYPLYLEVWSDHPPLLTHALAALFSVFGADVDVAQFFVLMLCSLLVFSCWRIVFLVDGTLSAVPRCCGRGGAPIPGWC